MSGAGSILITRPIEDARLFAAEIEELGHTALIAPLLEIEYLHADFSDLDKFDGLIFTSLNAVRALGDALKGYGGNLYAVGPKTAEALQNYSHQIYVGDGNVQDLERLLMHKAAGQSLLYLCGENVTKDLSSLPYSRCTQRIVYRSKILQFLGKNIVDAIEGEKIQAITVFSKRTAKALDAVIKSYKLQKSLKKIKILSISKDVLKCVHSYEWLESYSADEPHGSSMIALIQKTCQPS